MRLERQNRVRRAKHNRFVFGEPLERRLLLASVAGRVWNDYDADGAVDAAEPGLADWSVYQDLNDNGARDEVDQSAFDATDLPLAIPDLDQATSSLIVSGLVGAIADVNVTLNITHPWVGDISATLIGPGGVNVLLINRPGGSNNSGDDFTDTTLDDEAFSTVDEGFPPYSDSFRPVEPLARLKDRLPNGTWQLRVNDNAGEDVGTLNAWSVSITTTEPSAETDASGNYSFSNLPAGTHTFRTEPDFDFTSTVPADGSHTVTVGEFDVLAGQDFGARRTPGEVAGASWADLNADSLWDWDEPGLPGVTVYVDLIENSLFDVGNEPSAVTGPDGTYRIQDVPPGGWIVREVVPAGYQLTFPNVGAAAPVVATTRSSPRSVAPPAAAEPVADHSLDELLPHPFYKDEKGGAEPEPFTATDSSRWSSTATNGGGLTQGQATTITWHVVADDTPIGSHNGEGASPSNLRSFLDGIYGSEATWMPLFDQIFDSWSGFNGITYERVDYDDGGFGGTELSFGRGELGVRADIRIGGHFIDGNSNVLAYNFFPDVGDMVIDTADNFYAAAGSLANNSLGLRNVLAHEHGHGMGLSHVMPVSQTKLMEPFISFAFDGPQEDDILATNRLYGDRFEKGAGNDTIENATPLGAVDGGSASITNVSIDDDGDVDLFRFSVSGPKRASVTLNPVGTAYLSGTQDGASPTMFDARAQNDLAVEILRADGTVLGTIDVTGLGESELLENISLVAAGDYFVRVTGNANAAQGYDFTVVIEGSIAGAHFVDVTPGGAVENINFGNWTDGAPAVVARHLFYGRSSFVGRTGQASDDDSAIAADKQALLAGGTAAFANYTSYSRGINGIMVDVAGLPAGDLLGPADFLCQTGDVINGAALLDAPAPIVSVRRAAGAGGSDRVTLVWSDGAIKNTWLQVTLLAGANTGLAAPHVFSFGNLIGETGNSAAGASVDFSDLLGTRRAAARSVGMDNNFDFNRDGFVNTRDVTIVRANQRRVLELQAPVGIRRRPAVRPTQTVVRRPAFEAVSAAPPRPQRLLDEESGLLPA